MTKSPKSEILRVLAERFGGLTQLSGSQSLYVIGTDAARVYFRYSKLHTKGQAFFGLRQRDLAELEGHNSFICLLLDNGSSPFFLPYPAFEDLFHQARPAADGQYKVQLSATPEANELYIARLGRFNIDGYVGFEPLTRSLIAATLRPQLNLSHAQVQTLLAAIGHAKGYDVYVPDNNVEALDWSLTRKFAVMRGVPSGFDEIKWILSEIDVIWVTGGQNTITGLFEVEHSTSVYSGLLRFNDVLLTKPEVARFSIVSSDARRALFSRQVYRPTFRRSGLAELVGFLEYANVYDWHQRSVQQAKPAVA